MPELPEVEITRRGVAPLLVGRRIEALVVREPRLRWPIAPELPAQVAGRVVRALRRRAKYLIIELDRGAVILHLGMSGALRVVPPDLPPNKHDHLDLCMAGGIVLRLTDPRRFGSVHYIAAAPEQHPLLRDLGPEPFSDAFDASYLHRATRSRRTSIKEILLNGRIVVGVGNIYANEALHRAGIDPRTPAGRISRSRYAALIEAVQMTLQAALAAGGSSLRDWIHSDGASGYFQQQYLVYGRTGLPCRRCGETIREVRQGQRASFYCPRCQRR